MQKHISLYEWNAEGGVPYRITAVDGIKWLLPAKLTEGVGSHDARRDDYNRPRDYRMYHR